MWLEANIPVVVQTASVQYLVISHTTALVTHKFDLVYSVCSSRHDICNNSLSTSTQPLCNLHLTFTITKLYIYNQLLSQHCYVMWVYWRIYNNLCEPQLFSFTPTQTISCTPCNSFGHQVETPTGGNIQNRPESMLTLFCVAHMNIKWSTWEERIHTCGAHMNIK